MSRAAPVYHSGVDGRAFSTPPGGSTPIELAVTKWDITVKANNKDMSNALDKRYRIPGLADASGNLSMHFDSANSPADPTAMTGLNIRHGSVLALNLIPDGSTGAGSPPMSFRLSAIVDEVKMSSEIEGTVDYDVQWSLQAGSTLKYPGDA